MSLKTKRRQVIQEVPWGMLVWQMPDGEFLGDEDGNFMHVFVSNQDPALMEAAKTALTNAARSYGFPEGRPVFWAGRRPIDDEELESQLARANAGLVPDPLDIGAIREEAQALKQQNG
jgi:hypothetical protein